MAFGRLYKNYKYNKPYEDTLISYNYFLQQALGHLFMEQFDVIHLVSSLKIGGAERFVIDLAREQIRKGYKVAILSFSSELDPLVKIAKGEGVTVLFIKKRWWNKTFVLKKILVTAKVVHCHSLPVFKNITLVMPFLKNRRFVYTRHGERNITRWSFQLVHWFSKPFVDVVTFVSQGAKNTFVEQSTWNNKLFPVVENGVNTELFNLPSQELASSNIVRFGTVGRMIPLKAQQHLLEAVDLFSQENKVNCELHFIGDGPCKENIENLAASNHLTAQSFFHGMIIDRDSIFEKFDVLVVNSETEGLSIAIIEAMAYGVPVVATNVGGNPRLVIPDKTGWLYEYGDIDALANILETLVSNKALLDCVGTEAKEHIRNNFSIKKACETYNELYWR